MWLLGFLFAFGVGCLWWIEKYMKEVCDDLAYLIDLLDKNPDLSNKQDNQDKELDNQIRSREDLYK